MAKNPFKDPCLKLGMFLYLLDLTNKEFILNGRWDWMGNLKRKEFKI